MLAVLYSDPPEPRRSQEEIPKISMERTRARSSTHTARGPRYRLTPLISGGDAHYFACNGEAPGSARVIHLSNDTHRS